MQKALKVEGFLWEIGEREGVLGEIALLLPPSRVLNRGGWRRRLAPAIRRL